MNYEYPKESNIHLDCFDFAENDHCQETPIHVINILQRSFTNNQTQTLPFSLKIIEALTKT